MNWYHKVRLSCPIFFQKIAQTASANLEALKSQLPPDFELRQKPNGKWVVVGHTGVEEYEIVHDEPTPEQAISLALQRIAFLTAMSRHGITTSHFKN